MIRLNVMKTTGSPIGAGGETPKDAAGRWAKAWARLATKAFRTALLRAFGVWAV
jgi:hypothetical protein